MLSFTTETRKHTLVTPSNNAVIIKDYIDIKKGAKFKQSFKIRTRKEKHGYFLT